MNAQETIELLQALHAIGATRFESADFKVDFGRKTAAAAPIEQTASPNKDAEARVKDVIEKLSMSDDQLLDRIFPAGAER